MCLCVSICAHSHYGLYIIPEYSHVLTPIHTWCDTVISVTRLTHVWHHSFIRDTTPPYVTRLLHIALDSCKRAMNMMHSTFACEYMIHMCLFRADYANVLWLVFRWLICAFFAQIVKTGVCLWRTIFPGYVGLFCGDKVLLTNVLWIIHMCLFRTDCGLVDVAFITS